ncbi:MAG: hypothetical protein ACE5IY_12330 [bacterium]
MPKEKAWLNYMISQEIVPGRRRPGLLPLSTELRNSLSPSSMRSLQVVSMSDRPRLSGTLHEKSAIALASALQNRKFAFCAINDF